MKETPTHAPSGPKDSSASNLAGYFDKLGGKRTARHASEVGLHSPEVDDVRRARRDIRSDISGVFESEGRFESEPIELLQLKTQYWSRAQFVGSEHGAKDGFELDEYLQVGPGRSYLELKERLGKEYTPESIPGSMLDGVDAYYQVLGINPAHAATIMTELIGRGLPQIDDMARAIEHRDELSRQEATEIAFSDFIEREVPYHINSIIDAYGYGDAAVVPYMSKNSFYPETETQERDVTLQLSTGDVAGLVDVYGIQSRPYDIDELAMANELASDPAMQMAMIRIQESLVDSSAEYLNRHPDRAQADLRNFSEIFVPQGTGDELQLLPNPKLLRAMVNNVLPGVAKQLIERGVGAVQVDTAAIQQGIDCAAKEYKLFTAKIGQFSRPDPRKDTAELHSIYRVVCPANSLFPKFLTAHLAEYYAESKAKLEQ